MSETQHDATLYIKSQRFLQMRIPLFLLLGLNFMLICAVPFSQIYGNMVHGVTFHSFGDKAKGHGKTDGEKPVMENAPGTNHVATPKHVADKNPIADSILIADKNPIGVQAIKRIDLTEPNPESVVIEVTEKELELILGSNPFSADGGVKPADSAQVGTSPSNIEPQPLNPKVAMAMQVSIRGGVSQFTKVCVRQMENVLSATDHLLIEPAARVPVVESPLLVLHNPLHWEVEIHYLVDGEIHTLFPGETHDLGLHPGPKRIEFHRGGAFADTSYELAAGHFEFHASAEGWELVQINDTENVVEEQIP